MGKQRRYFDLNNIANELEKDRVSSSSKEKIDISDIDVAVPEKENIQGTDYRPSLSQAELNQYFGDPLTADGQIQQKKPGLSDVAKDMVYELAKQGVKPEDIEDYYNSKKIADEQPKANALLPDDVVRFNIANKDKLPTPKESGTITEYVEPPLSEKIFSRIGEAGKNVAKSALETASSTAGGLKDLFDAVEYNPLIKNAIERLPGNEAAKVIAIGGKKLGDVLSGISEEIKTNPAYEREFLTTTLPSALGSQAVFMLSGALGSAAKLPVAGTTALTGALAQLGSEYKNAKQKTNDPDKLLATVLINGVIGTSEAAPISRLFNRMDKVSGGTLGKEANKLLSKPILKMANAEGLEEFTQESLQNIATDITAEQLYDETRNWKKNLGQSVEQSAAGYIVGFLSMLVGAKLRQRGLKPEEKEKLEEASQTLQTASQPIEPQEKAIIPDAEQQTADLPSLEELQDAEGIRGTTETPGEETEALEGATEFLRVRDDENIGLETGTGERAAEPQEEKRSIAEKTIPELTASEVSTDFENFLPKVHELVTEKLREIGIENPDDLNDILLEAEIELSEKAEQEPDLSVNDIVDNIVNYYESKLDPPSPRLVKQAKELIGQSFDEELQKYLGDPLNQSIIGLMQDKTFATGMLVEQFARELVNGKIKIAPKPATNIVGEQNGRAIKMNLPNGEEKIFVMGNGSHVEPMTMAFRYIVDDMVSKGIDEKKAMSDAEEFISQAAINNQMDIGDVVEGEFKGSWNQKDVEKALPQQIEEPEEGVRNIPKQEKVYPAIRDVHTGEITTGQIHPEAIENKFVNEGNDINDLTEDKMNELIDSVEYGFIDREGKFLTQDQAREYLKKNEFESMDSKDLDAQGLVEPIEPKNKEEGIIDLTELVEPESKVEEKTSIPEDKLLGKNDKGQEIYEDSKGIRYKLEGEKEKIIVRQPVSLIPTREGIKYSPEMRDEFLTTEEIETKRNQEQPIEEPTEAQKEAGNYKMEHIRKEGFEISIENKAGSIRKGVDKDGEEWQTEMQNDYGYLKGTVGKDKDHLDVFMSNDYKEDSPAFIVNQTTPEGKFDEHKVMLGFDNKEDALKAYLSNYKEGWSNYKDVVEMPIDEFKTWAKDKEKTKVEAKEVTSVTASTTGDTLIQKHAKTITDSQIADWLKYENDKPEGQHKIPAERYEEDRPNVYNSNVKALNRIKDAVDKKDYTELSSMLHTGNKMWRKYFTEYSGVILPNTEGGTKNKLQEFVGKEQYQKYLDIVEVANKKREENKRTDEIESVLRGVTLKKYKYQNESISAKDLIDKLLDEGNYKVEKIKQGIKPVYRVFSKEGFIPFTSKEEKAYIDYKLENKPVTNVTPEQNQSGIKAVRRNEELNGIEIEFVGKPEKEVITKLKVHGFRWKKGTNYWYAKHTARRLQFANDLAGITEEPITQIDNEQLKDRAKAALRKIGELSEAQITQKVKGVSESDVVAWEKEAERIQESKEIIEEEIDETEQTIIDEAETIITDSEEATTIEEVSQSIEDISEVVEKIDSELDKKGKKSKKSYPVAISPKEWGSEEYTIKAWACDARLIKTGTNTGKIAGSGWEWYGFKRYKDGVWEGFVHGFEDEFGNFSEDELKENGIKLITNVDELRSIAPPMGWTWKENYSEIDSEEIEQEPQKTVISKKPSKLKEKIKSIESDELNDALDDFMKSMGVITSGIDPVQLAKGMKVIEVYTKLKVYKFADIVNDLYAKMGDKVKEILDALKQAYASYRETAPEDIYNKMDASTRGFDIDQLLDLKESENISNIQPEGETSDVESIQTDDDGILEGEKTEPLQGTKTKRGTGKRSGKAGRHDGEGGTGRDAKAEGKGQGAGTAISGRTGNRKSPTDELNQSNYRITDQDGIGETSFNLDKRFSDNINAIRTLKTILEEDRPATKAEKKVLVKYVGWGGIPQAFKEGDPKWGERNSELKSLLAKEEYEQARSSTINAHYTSPTIINSIYSATKRLGFKGGRILEPSLGIGHFFGLLPKNISVVSKLYGVELDTISAQISQKLYPDAYINDNSQKGKGFQEVYFPQDYFDLIVSNVPFGDIRIFDETEPKSFWSKNKQFLHDFFFMKSLDKIKPGGLLVFVTSKGTMDKMDSIVRQYLNKSADLLGAIRLPKTAFKNNANTEVITDIIFLRKKDGKKIESQTWIESDKEYIGNFSYYKNEYFKNHHEMILGTESMTGSMYGANEYTITLSGDLETEISKAINKLPKDVITTTETKNDFELAEMQDYSDQKLGSFVEKDGEIYVVHKSRLTVHKTNAQQKNRITSLITLRNKLNEVIKRQFECEDDNEVNGLIKELNTLYDKYVSSNGYLNNRRTYSVFGDDPDYPRLAALETIDVNTGKITKADILSKRVFSPIRLITKVESTKDGLTASLSIKGSVDIPYISQISGLPEEQVIEELEKDNLIFLNPETEKYITADEYLSGDIKTKLLIAKKRAESEPKYQVHVDALTEVIPEDINYIDISATMGSTWIPSNVYKQFAIETFGGKENSISRFERSKIDGKVFITYDDYYFDEIKNNNEYGTGRISAMELFSLAMNFKTPAIYDSIYEHGERKHVINREASELAKLQQDKIKEEFVNWIWKDDNRKVELEKIYNEEFNRTVNRELSGQHLTFPNIAKEVNGEPFQLREYQKDSIWRIMNSPTTLLAHKVGAGKTATMIIGAMEMKRIGRIRKAAIVVPNSIVGQWEQSFRALYPQAKVLAPTRADFETKNRRKLLAKIATNDYDAVIIALSHLHKIPMSEEFQEQYLRDRIYEIDIAISELEESSSGQRNSPETREIKRLEKLKQKMTERIREARSNAGADIAVSFEELGIDYLFVDEAHNYKNLYLPTQIINIRGVNKSDSGQANDLYMKVLYMHQRYKGNITFATGTPVSNTLTEFFVMQRYLQPEMLKKYEIFNLDSWVHNFGSIVKRIEVSSSGTGYQTISRLSKLNNFAEIKKIYAEIADIRGPEEVDKYLTLPKMDGDKPIVEIVEPSDEVLDYWGKLAERAEWVKKNPKEKKTDNMLKVTSDARKSSVDMRLIDPKATDYPNSKVNKTIKNVLEIYKQETENKGTQLVFLDEGVPGGRNFNLYSDIKKKLIKGGVNAEEVAFAQDYDTEKQKQQLHSNVNSGKIRIVIGSTAVLSEGVNVQRRLKALHHLSVPWKPANIEQREGRILRHGNIYTEVKIFRYVLQGSGTMAGFDAYLWNILETKARGFSSAMSRSSTARSLEESEAKALTYAEAKALATGNPLVMERVELEDKLLRAERLYYAKESEKTRLHRSLGQEVAHLDDLINIAPKIKEAAKNVSEEFVITIEGVTYSGKDAKKEGGRSIVQLFEKELEKYGVAERVQLKISDASIFDKFNKTKIGNIGEFEIYPVITNTATLIELRHPNGLVRRSEVASIGGITSNKIEDTLLGLVDYSKRIDKDIKESETRIVSLKKELAKPIENAEDLRKLRNRLAEIDKALGVSEAEHAGADVTGQSEDSEENADDADDNETVTFSASLIPTDFRSLKDIKDNFNENTESIKNVLAVGASIIKKGVNTYPAWVKEMVARFGKEIRRYARKVWVKIREIGKELKTEFAKQVLDYASKKGIISSIVDEPLFGETKAASKIEDRARDIFDSGKKRYAEFAKELRKEFGTQNYRRLYLDILKEQKSVPLSSAVESEPSLLEREIATREEQIAPPGKGHMVHMRERTLIKQKISEFKKGYKTGEKETKKELEFLKRQISGYAREYLPTTLRKSEITPLMTQIAKADSIEDVEKAFDRIDSIIKNNSKNYLIRSIYNALQTFKPRKEKGILKGKRLTADEYALLGDIRAIVALKPAQIEQMREEFLKRVDDNELEFDDEMDEFFYQINLFGDLENKTVEQLRQVLDEIKEIIVSGISKRQGKRDIAKKKRMAVVQQIIKEVTKGGRGVLTEQELRKLGEDNKKFYDYMSYMHNLESMFDAMTYDKSKGMYEGTLNKFFIPRIKEAHRKQFAWEEEYQKMIRSELMKIYGIKENEFANSIKLARILNKNKERIEKTGVFYKNPRTEAKEELKLSQNEAAKKWMEYQDTKLRPTFVKMGWNEETIKQLEDFLTPEIKQWAKFQLKEVYPKIGKEVNEIYREYFGVDMPFVENYSPLTREYDKIQGEDGTVLLGGKTHYSSIVNAHCKARISNTRPLRFIDMDDALGQQIVQMGHFIAFADVVKDMRIILQNEEVQKAINQNHGYHYKKMINNQINDLARGGSDRGLVLNFLEKALKRFVPSVLGMNPSITLKQLTSLPAYSSEIPRTAFISGILDFVKNPIKAVRILSNTDYLKERYGKGFERDIIASLQKKTTGAFAGTKNIRDGLMILISLGDKGSAYLGGWTVYKYNYDKAIKEGKSISDAKSIAETAFQIATDRTQQSGETEDLSGLQKMGTFGKILTLFMTQPASYFRQEWGAIRNITRGRGKFSDNLYKVALYHAILPAIFQFVASGFPGLFSDWDDKDKGRMLRAITLGSFNGLLIFGNMLEYLFNIINNEKWYGFSQIPLQQVPESMGVTVRKIKKVIDEDKWQNMDMETALETIDAVMQSADKITGIPYYSGKRIYEGAKDISEGEGSPIKVLGYSDYALGNDKKSSKATPRSISRPNRERRIMNR